MTLKTSRALIVSLRKREVIKGNLLLKLDAIVIGDSDWLPVAQLKYSQRLNLPFINSPIVEINSLRIGLFSNGIFVREERIT